MILVGLCFRSNVQLLLAANNDCLLLVLGYLSLAAGTFGLIIAARGRRHRSQLAHATIVRLYQGNQHGPTGIP